MFGQLLSAQLQGSKTASLGSSPSGSAQLATLASQLQAQITQMLKNGMSLEQIAQQLGGSLSSSILAQLQLQGVNVSGLRSSLTKMISQALGPPSNGPPDQTAAQMASSLVQRFTQIANALTTTVSAYATGQQHDSLGTSSDANAGGSSAPSQTAGIVQSALVALQQSAVNGSASAASAATLGSQSGGPAAPPAPWVPSAGPLGNNATPTNGLATQTMHPQTASDAQIPQNSGGPTVAANPSLTMQGTGADTVIGRILARAANVAADQANSGSNPSSTTDTPNATATLQPQIAVTGAASASGGGLSDSLTASLLQSMQNAINSIPQQKSDSSTTADSSAPVAGVGGAQASTLLANASFGGLSPLVSTTGNTPTTAAPQSQTPAQVPVDPNAVVDQVLQGISMRTLSDGSQTVRMRLVPETLGSVTVNLQVQGSSVNATLVAQNTDVRDALLANQQMLTRSLADAGLKLAGFTVNLANQGFQQQQQAYQPRFGTTRRFVGVTTSSDDDTIASVPSYGPPSSQLAAMQWLNALA